MRLKASEIRYSQEAINDRFKDGTRYGGRKIGETLDDICEERCQISDIPMISVKMIYGRWTTADNRRLWVFRELERLGKCTEIDVMTTSYIDPRKLSSKNGGTSVRVRRGGPGGCWYLKRPGDSFNLDDGATEPRTKETHFVHPIYSTFMVPRANNGIRTQLRLSSTQSSLGSLDSNTNTERYHQDEGNVRDSNIGRGSIKNLIEELSNIHERSTTPKNRSVEHFDYTKRHLIQSDRASHGKDKPKDKTDPDYKISDSKVDSHNGSSDDDEETDENMVQSVPQYRKPSVHAIQKPNKGKSFSNIQADTSAPLSYSRKIRDMNTEQNIQTISSGVKPIRHTLETKSNTEWMGKDTNVLDVLETNQYGHDTRYQKEHNQVSPHANVKVATERTKSKLRINRNELALLDVDTCNDRKTQPRSFLSAREKTATESVHVIQKTDSTDVNHENNDTVKTCIQPESNLLQKMLNTRPKINGPQQITSSHGRKYVSKATHDVHQEGAIQSTKNDVSRTLSRPHRNSSACSLNQSVESMHELNKTNTGTARASSREKSHETETASTSKRVSNFFVQNQMMTAQSKKPLTESSTLNSTRSSSSQKVTTQDKAIDIHEDNTEDRKQDSGTYRRKKPKPSLRNKVPPSVPIIAGAVKERLQVAAIDFGTTYSGYAFSFRNDFVNDPLKIVTNQWTTGSNQSVSLKTPSCILFEPSGKFHSFGFDAEDMYADLAAEGNHVDWYYFKRFKMLLYDKQDLSRQSTLRDDKGKEMPAMKVFSESIKFLKHHFLDSCTDRQYGLEEDEIHWVLTVPAIWDDTAKLFMREAAIEAGIDSDHLSLALEPEAASMFCKHLPVNKIQGVKGAGITCFSPGTRYMVLDAGGGTVDITVHETQRDGTVKELYKANGGPWGGTRADEAFNKFLTDVSSPQSLEQFKRTHMEDYLDIMREFEVKKSMTSPDMEQRITIKLPVSFHETYSRVHGDELRASRVVPVPLQPKISFTGDKLRVQPDVIQGFFSEVCQRIVDHLRDVFNKPEVRGTDTILMVGGFSESRMLQDAVRRNFPDKTVIIPAEAGLAVLKGAVIFGHNPTVITARVVRCTYGVGTCVPFKPGVHPQTKLVHGDDGDYCEDVFDGHVNIGDQVEDGTTFESHSYFPLHARNTRMHIGLYTSDRNTPTYTDEDGCNKIQHINVDLPDGTNKKDKEVKVYMKYGGAELHVEAIIVKTQRRVQAKFDFVE